MGSRQEKLSDITTGDLIDFLINTVGMEKMLDEMIEHIKVRNCFEDKYLYTLTGDLYRALCNYKGRYTNTSEK